ncbi:MAG: YidC/Oxa1 family insertase periplasmic-domain containing protein [Victivallales bacterium]|nr:YidC/Oxa1 family insertase periplasmic-domain containing protein [Victivallales bacterium]
MNKSSGKYDIVTFVGVAVSVIALVAILVYRPGMPKNGQAQTAPVVQTPAAPAQQPSAPGQPAQQVATPEASAQSSPQASQAGNPAALLAADVAQPRTRGTQGEQLLNAGDKGQMITSVDKEGNGVVSIELGEYLVDVPRKGQENPPKVRISSHDYPFLCLTANWLATQGFGKAEAKELEGGQQGIVLERRSANGKILLRESWKLVDPSKYELLYDIDIVNEGEEPVSLSDFFIEGGSMPASVTPARKAGRGESAGGITLGKANGKPDTLFMRDLIKMKENRRQEIQSTQVNWTAVHSKYFLLSLWMVDGKAFSGAEVAAVVPGTGDDPSALTGPRYHVRAKLPPFMVEAGKSQKFSIKAYAGPKKFSALSGYGLGLQSVMDMDRFFFWRPKAMSLLSEYLLKMLVWLSEVFPKSIGYGLGVILLTVLVKLIFWPLSHKSTKSMRKMAALKPQLDEIKAKYKDDPQTMYRKQQELFKQNDVSQLGGCLPMLLQIPVFFALFNTFRNAIELRHASFLWAYDLSMPDTLAFSPERLPIRPLALLMGGLMYYQQKLTPNPDPQQSKMMSYMSIFFILLFYGMPSALTLYLSVSYLLGIVQTIVTNKMMPPVATPSVNNK